MITVIREPHCITVSGHAKYAPAGQDIVCASVSALAQTLAYSPYLHPVSVDSVEGFLQIVLKKDLSEAEEVLVESFFIGINAIADQYPDYVKVVLKD